MPKLKPEHPKKHLPILKFDRTDTERLSYLFNHRIEYLEFPNKGYSFIWVVDRNNIIQQRLFLKGIFPTVMVKYVVSTEDNIVKAHELYHHLIRHHAFMISSDKTQSIGGANIWRRLFEYDDIKMRHVTKTSVIHDFKPNWFDNYGDPHSVFIAMKELKC